MDTLIWTADDASDVYGWTPARKPVVASILFIEDDLEDEDDELWWDDDEDGENKTDDNNVAGGILPQIQYY